MRIRASLGVLLAVAVIGGLLPRAALVFAVGFQALVWLCGSLCVAMAVHALEPDCIAAWSREGRRPPRGGASW